ncbi:hypothetical protein [Microvirga vignae]|uniref:hypothetical protein n=1 Tax=Microvirga vignae TaxID=1225564 RepID=UPI0012371F37|nr:hypothetical protein [Microvirga vignae]
MRDNPFLHPVLHALAVGALLTVAALMAFAASLAIMAAMIAMPAAAGSSAVGRCLQRGIATPAIAVGSTAPGGHAW